ncbi:MAG: type II secretion system F family protein [Fusicatenibacter sp.]
MKTEYQVWHFGIREYVRIGLASLAITGGINFLCYRALWAFLIWPLVFAFCLNYRRALLIQKRKETLYDHFRDLISSMHSALRSGYSLENAVTEAARDLALLYGREDAMVQELKAMVRQMALSVPVEQLFEDLAKRSGIEDIRTFAGVLVITKRTGGSMDEVFQNTWEIFCSRIDTMRQIRSGIASRRYEQTVMNLIPFGIILYIQISFPEFMDQMYGNMTGFAVMTVCLLLYVSAWLLGEKILDVEV